MLKYNQIGAGLGDTDGFVQYTLRLGGFYTDLSEVGSSLGRQSGVANNLDAICSEITNDIVLRALCLDAVCPRLK